MEFPVNPMMYGGNNMDYGIRSLPAIKVKDDFWQQESLLTKQVVKKVVTA